ncbi:iron dicitrate transport regulator FecR [Achromobacter xylosoxidans]|uniref:FecR domain-containing protein n=1 Tax=Alcaligenes xylosoxydans xylosoxydans TaxID=85698 RepID=UPI000DD172DE|nr:FecR family protein [Achromobacter xylosoxidans]AXA77927.1 iron dicitrate transport regulator FecR [Achromobacter xylosoxidans]
MTRVSAPPVAYAGGLPLPPHVAEQASRWYVLLMSGADTVQDRLAWERWRQADPDHERAWVHLMRADGRIRELEGSPAYQALTAERRKGRRRALIAMLGLAACTGVLAWTADRTRWVRLSPDHVAGVGEQRTVELVDGSEVLLNTDSAIDVLYDGRARRLRLRRGEIQVRTGHAAGYAGLPFRVDTPAGGVRALGTRFIVRLDGDQTRVALLEGLVEIEPVAGGSRLLLQPGQATRYGARGIEPVRPVALADTAWVNAELAADDMPLDRFLAELSRYRHGLISCDATAARLRISGLFPLNDTDRALQAVARLLPVTVTRRSPYWVRVSAR